jgi:hypothetical protein
VLAVVVAALGAASAVSAVDGAADSARHAGSRHARSDAPTVPTGQTTVTYARTGFGAGVEGWQPLDSTLRWSPNVGHRAPGALVLDPSSGRSATSAPFDVTAGARYSVRAWARARSDSHQVVVGLRFFDGDGNPIPDAGQLSQPRFDVARRWTTTYRAVGFAPADAVKATAVVATLGASTDAADRIDDVRVWETTGAPTPVAGPLTTDGSTVLDAQGRRVTLHGVQLGGMKSTGWTPDTVSTAQIDAAHRWGANFARLPVAENPMVPDDCSFDQSYVDTVDRIVNDVTSRGMVLLLDLHTNAVSDCGDWSRQQKLPDAKAVTFWQTVADRYKDNPLVAFDLYNEPHGVRDHVWRDGGTLTSSGVTYDAVGMQQLYDTVRATGAQNLVVASGRAWASVYPATAPFTGTTNLVWGVHAYTCPIATPADGGTCRSGPDGVKDPSGILGGFARVGRTQPVMVTEFGWPNPADGDYLRAVDAYATGHGWLGWNAFVFNNFIGSQFDLMKDDGPLWNPRPTGAAVITAMLGD